MATSRQAVAKQPHVVVLSGLSGGGKTAAAKLFEDLGYIVVDNLPGELLPNLAELVVRTRSGSPGRDRPRRPGRRRGGRLSRDARRPRGPRPPAAGLLPRGPRRDVIRRFSETRHRHPLAKGRGTQAAITLERRLLDPDPRRGRRRRRHVGPVAPRAPRAAVHPPRRPRAGRHGHPAHQLRLQVRRPARGGPRLRHALPPEPVLRSRAARALRPDGAGPRFVLDQPGAGDSSSSSRSCWRSPSRPSSTRARAG